MKISEFFSENELSCRCCGRCAIHKNQLIALDKLREELNAPLLVTSGFRCEEHNKKVGGSKNSWHKKGLATDLFSTKKTVDEIAFIAEKYFFEVIRYKDKNFCHVGNPK